MRRHGRAICKTATALLRISFDDGDGSRRIPPPAPSVPWHCSCTLNSQITAAKRNASLPTRDAFEVFTNFAAPPRVRRSVTTPGGSQENVGVMLNGGRHVGRNTGCRMG